jgi:hypothetical protein
MLPLAAAFLFRSVTTPAGLQRLATSRRKVGLASSERIVGLARNGDSSLARTALARVSALAGPALVDMIPDGYLYRLRVKRFPVVKSHLF